jgi:hypothetical protein
MRFNFEFVVEGSEEALWYHYCCVRWGDSIVASANDTEADVCEDSEELSKSTCEWDALYNECNPLHCYLQVSF